MHLAVDNTCSMDELKRLTESLENTERFFEAFLRQCPICMWCKELDGDSLRMVFISDQYTNIFGVKNIEYVGRTDAEVWPRHIADYFKQQDLQVINTGRPVYEVEPTPIAQDPDWRVCQTLKFPITNNEGTIVGVGGIAWPLNGKRV